MKLPFATLTQTAATDLQAAERARCGHDHPKHAQCTAVTMDSLPMLAAEEAARYKEAEDPGEDRIVRNRKQLQ